MGMIITTLLCFVIAVTLVIIFIIVVVMFVITVVITFMVKNTFFINITINTYSQALCVGCVLMLGGLCLRREESIREVFLLAIPAAVLCCYPGVRSLR